MQAREVPALPRPARGCSFGEVSRRVLPPIWGLRPSPLILQLIYGDVQYGNMRTLRICRTGAFRRGRGHRGNYAGRSNPSRLSRGRGKCHRLYTSRACAGSRGVCWFYRVCISVSWVTTTFSLVQILTYQILFVESRSEHDFFTLAAQRARGGAGAPRPSARLPLALSLYLAGHPPLRFIGRLACDL